MGEWDADTAEWYAEKYGEYDTNRLGIGALELAPDSVVVDIGCGTGCALRYAAKKVVHGTLIGVDPVPRMVEIAREKTANSPAADRIVFYEGGAESLPIESDTVDVVLAFDSFDHWRDQREGLNEVRRVLKPKGILVVVKDGGLPNGTEARQQFLKALEVAEFSVASEKNIEEGDVTFTQWVCTLKS